jgi:hypothetical protein
MGFAFACALFFHEVDNAARPEFAIQLRISASGASGAHLDVVLHARVTRFVVVFVIIAAGHCCTGSRANNAIRLF